MRGLTDEQIDRFVHDGLAHVEGAFPREVADAGRELLWKATGCDPEDAATWTQPVIRLGDFAQEPFRAAANTPRLHAEFAQPPLLPTGELDLENPASPVERALRDALA